MTTTPDLPKAEPTPAAVPGHEVPFGVNALRLDARQWLLALAILLGCFLGFPRIWKQVERFDTGPDYRIPYSLSKDYWLYQRRLEQIADPTKVPVLGDSVVWGEYVSPSGTLTHFLNREAGQGDRFINCGVNALFPLAMEGLVEHYGETLRDRKVVVHCNVLWMSSPRADLSTKKEESFNHSRLVPQFTPRIPCYAADAAERLSVVIERNVGLFAWVGHVDDAYFDQRSIPNWTLQDDGSDPPHRPDAWCNPLARITLAVPGEPEDDTQRGPASSRHKPWSDGGAKPARFDWVGLDASLQWQAFQRVIGLLRGRGNDVLVVLGPFNESMVADPQRPTFRKLRDGIAAWLVENRVAHIIPETLPSNLYADASHPLTDGYALLAKRIWREAAFGKWLGAK